ncbi:MAG: hypothetical protein PUJ93_04670 [Oscillospiraceae bacterium]|nr:hypothetical protein [Oscillospiraceae bacterium]MDD7538261.1 hypothetical protein [Oscillospiraceae bacterium]MDY5735795.1 hypothetical protein [Oscillospiraceae bacterium]
MHEKLLTFSKVRINREAFDTAGSMMPNNYTKQRKKLQARIAMRGGTLALLTGAQYNGGKQRYLRERSGAHALSVGFI